MRLLPSSLLVALSAVAGCVDSCGTEATLLAQNGEPRFEKVLIDRVTNRPTGTHMCELSGGAAWCDSRALVDVIADAHGVPPHLIVNVPDWVAANRFTIYATLPLGVRTSPVRVIGGSEQRALVTLLEDRFRLSVHSEVRETDTYDLIRRDQTGPFGPALCVGTEEQCPRSEMPSEPSPAGLTRSFQQGTECCSGVALWLSRELRVPVMDRANVNGGYRLTVTWTVGNEESLRKALRDQLGFELRPSRARLKVLVIDHIERPSEN